MANFKHRINPDSTELERYFLSVYTGHLWDALEKIKDWHSPEHIEKEVQMKLLKLQHQALPVVPECVAEYIEQSKGNLSLYGALYGIVKETDTELHKWASEKGNRDIFARAWLDGYTVEKPQLFYLKNKLTGLWLIRDNEDKEHPYDHSPNMYIRAKFTQLEIESMETGSYELVPVEDGE